MQAAFPEAKGFSARNLWWMKQWYSFYTSEDAKIQRISKLELPNADSQKLNQLGSEMREQRLNQLGSEIPFPPTFVYVPWRHHVMIIQKCKSIEEVLFYIQKTKLMNEPIGVKERYFGSMAVCGHTPFTNSWIFQHRCSARDCYLTSCRLRRQAHSLFGIR